LIKLRDVTIAYKTRVTEGFLASWKVYVPLKGINLTLYSGELLTISGPNGSGKTSLLNVMSGLLQPFSGKVMRKASNFGYVSQDQILLPELTIKENILLPFYLRHEKHHDKNSPLVQMKADEVFNRLKTFVKRFNIDDILDKRPAQCSIGQQQRALLTRALIMDCEVIFADEPEQNLDSEGRLELFESIREANELYHKTIVLVSQEHVEILKKYVTRSLKIKDGNLVEIFKKAT